MTAAPPDPAATTGRLARAYAWTVVKLRWPLLLGWAAGGRVRGRRAAGARTAAGLARLARAGQAPPALRANTLALHLFRVPLTAETEIVQRDPARPPAGRHGPGVRAGRPGRPRGAARSAPGAASSRCRS